MLVAIFLIVIGSDCRARGKVGQDNIGTVISNKSARDLSKNNMPKNNLADSVDNHNWWPDEIAVPFDAISNSQIAKDNPKTNAQIEHTQVNSKSKNNNSLSNNTDNNRNNSAENNVIIPPRQLALLPIEPKPLQAINGTINQDNNFELQNNKNSHPRTIKSNNTNNKTPIKTVAANELLENQSDTANSSTGMSLREFETILTQAKWQPNIQLEHWLDNGMKLSENKKDNLSKERREQIKQLNLSDKEKLKNNQKQKYIDELISTWRWYNSDIDELVKKQLDPDSESRPIFPVDPKIFLEKDTYQNAKYNILRANAAILMGRCNDYDAVNSLIEIVKNERLDGIRCAAVETLGKMEHVGFEVLIPMLEFARKRNNVTNNHTDNKHDNNDLDDDTNIDRGNRKNLITIINKVLWAELLVAIANKIEPWEHPCFLDSLAADEVEVRRASAKLWRLRSQAVGINNRSNANYRNEKDQSEQLRQLPRRFLVFARQENDLQTRIEIITTLGIWKEPEILDIVTNDLNHADMRLRFAAMDAVTAAECKAAERILKDKLRDISVKTRAKSAESLRKLGFIDEVLRLADDKEHEVRIEVAKSIAFAPNPRILTLAQRYIENDYEDVKLATLYSLAEWDRIDLSGKILIESLQNRSLKVRKLSAEILSGYFPTAVELLSKNHASDKDRIKIVTEIKKQLDEYLQSSENKSESIILANNKVEQRVKRVTKNGANNNIEFSKIEIDEVFELVDRLHNSGLLIIQKEEIKRKLVNYGDRLLPILEYLYENYDNFELPKLVDAVLADVNEIFGLILLLDSDSEMNRRKSAVDLLGRSKVESLGGLACSRILERALCESDMSMLVMYLKILRNSDAYKSRYLAASVLNAEFNSVELRRIACDVFGELGNGYDLIIVAQNLGDQRRDVSHAAFTAMVKILMRLEGNEFEDERDKAATKLWSKFVGSDSFSQVEISAAVYLLGDESGAKSLLRESFSPDVKIRLHVANVIGIMGDLDFMSILIRYLDDKDTNVRQAALTILPKLAGEDIGIIETKIPIEHELSQSQKKIARWKKWYKNNDTK
jgi:HEAT repeat protein